ncbi:MAG: hypothetical protein ACOCWC_02430 [Bacteroidota bacterium]
MKEKELYVDFQPQQAVYYVEKEDSSYGPIVSGSQLSHDYLDDFYKKRGNLEKNLRDKMANNEISPVYYYMLLQEMGLGDLAPRVGVSKRRLKKHFKAEVFKKLPLNLIKKYADVFNVPLSNMMQVVIIKEEDNKSLEIEKLRTNNDCFEILRVGLKGKE